MTELAAPNPASTCHPNASASFLPPPCPQNCDVTLAPGLAGEAKPRPLQFSRAATLGQSRYRRQMSSTRPEAAERILGSTEEANPSVLPFWWVHSPQADNAQETRSCHSHQQPVPFPHEVCCQGQQHVPNAPEDADQDPSEGAVLDIHPLHPWKREAASSWDMQDFSRKEGLQGFLTRAKRGNNPGLLLRKVPLFG